MYMRYDVIFRELTKSEFTNVCGFPQFISFLGKRGCKRRHLWQSWSRNPVPNRFASLEGRPCGRIKKNIIPRDKVEISFDWPDENMAREDNSSGKEFSTASRSIFSHWRSAEMAHLDLAFASYRFSRATGLDKTRRLFMRFSFTMVERILVGLGIRGLPPLLPPSTSRKQWLLIKCFFSFCLLT